MSRPGHQAGQNREVRLSACCSSATGPGDGPGGGAIMRLGGSTVFSATPFCLSAVLPALEGNRGDGNQSPLAPASLLARPPIELCPSVAFQMSLLHSLHSSPGLPRARDGLVRRTRAAVVGSRRPCCLALPEGGPACQSPRLPTQPWPRRQYPPFRIAGDPLSPTSGGDGTRIRGLGDNPSIAGSGPCGSEDGQPRCPETAAPCQSNHTVGRPAYGAPRRSLAA